MPATRSDTAPRLLATVGPSASGKSSVVRLLAGRGLLVVHPTWTTRRRRPDELGGSLEHRFVSDAEFDEAEARGDFVATATPFGLPYRYGLPHVHRRRGGPVGCLMLRSRQLELVRALVGEPLVYAFVADGATTARRLGVRSLSDEERRAREADDTEERALARAVADRCFDTSGTAARVEPLADAVAAALHHDLGSGG